ncbi:lipase (plasmid) [Persicobacter psychrovividus]|uniref:Lipase n=2 Tax=Persicobacter psychrovividus TaxID=387638 RepID=A0ABN6LBL4_9BACT|nr:lipase [Persicobacter psychrovividus]
MINFFLKLHLLTMKKLQQQAVLTTILFLFFTSPIFAQKAHYKLLEKIPYYSKKEMRSDDYMKSQCRLKIYYPEDKKDFATVVWFHGGGLSGGDNDIPAGLKNQGVAVVSVQYRFHPKVKSPVYVEDAAASVAWVFKHIKEYNGDPSKIFLSGHSAGGYLDMMVGLDKKYLAKYNIDANDIAGMIPLSGHTITHFTIRKERGIDGKTPIIDDMAPLYHCRKDASPLLLITGDRHLELLGRQEENAYMYRMMKVNGATDVHLLELQGYNHGIIKPGCPLVINEVHRILKKNSK